MRRAANLLAIAALVLTAPTDASACACCANTAQRSVSTAKASEYDAAQLARIAFDGNAELFTGEAEPADIRGLSATSSDYAMDVARDADRWIFTFKAKDKIAGTLAFAPDKLAKFEVDTRLADPPAGSMISLYKEWKQTAPVIGTGMFKLPAGSSLSLILQGGGNSCTGAEDFTRWSLVAQGDGFSFHFFGNLAKPN